MAPDSSAHNRDRASSSLNAGRAHTYGIMLKASYTWIFMFVVTATQVIVNIIVQ
jgi:hypothetical protein